MAGEGKSSRRHIQASVNHLLQHLELLLEQGAQPTFSDWRGEMCVTGFDSMDTVLIKRFWKRKDGLKDPILVYLSVICMRKMNTHPWTRERLI